LLENGESLLIGKKRKTHMPVAAKTNRLSLIRTIKDPQEPEIWATGSLMEIDLQRLKREFVGKPSWIGSPSELSQRDAARLSSGS